ncbi:MAG: hypothetical protein LH629_08440 [Ignavibacteria bacterium]|nr:hypothetical protein [Ignavibacteria bacterium]
MKKNRHKLFDDYSFEISDYAESSHKFFSENRNKVFNDFPIFFPYELMTSDERSK